MIRKHLRPLLVAAATVGVTLGAQALPVGGEVDPFVNQQGMPHEAPAPLPPTMLSGPWQLQGDVVSPEQEVQWRPPSVALRDEVRAEYFELLDSGALNRPGEIAEPRDVLMARAELNEEMADSLRLALQAEQARLMALQYQPVAIVIVTPAPDTTTPQ